MKNIELLRIKVLSSDAVDFYTDKWVILWNKELNTNYHFLINDWYTPNEAINKIVNEEYISIEKYIPNKDYIVQISNIDWDVDEEEDRKYLPTSIKNLVIWKEYFIDEINSRFDQVVEEYISDYLSDTYEFCHNGFNFTVTNSVA